MEFILIVAFFVVVVAVFGHAIWLFAAAGLRVLTGTPVLRQGSRDHSSKISYCPECGTSLARHALLANDSSATSRALAIRDLRTTLRQLELSRDKGLLDSQTFERARDCIDAQLTRLRFPPKPIPQVRPLEAIPVVEPILSVLPVEQPKPVAPPLQHQVQEFLNVCQDVRELAGKQEERVVEWYRKKGESAEAVSATPVPESAAAEASADAVSSVVEPPPKTPRRSLPEMLGAFMQESNIVWGELVAGLVMVGSSIALVISLWKTLEQSVPYFPFLIFTAITVAIFGAGLYSFNHWKLESTSRGLLVIAILLVPLNFLVMAGLLVQHGAAASELDLFRLGSELVAFGVFAWFLGKAGRVLLGAADRWLSLAVLGISASVLAAPRLLGENVTDLWRSIVSGGLPVACFLGGTLGMQYRSRRSLETQRAKYMLLFLGLAVFPLILALGFLLFWSQKIGLDGHEAAQRLSLLLALAGVPLVMGGLAVGRLGDPTPDSGLGFLRTAGSAVAFCGVAILLTAVPLAWPNTWLLAAVCLFNYLVLTAVAGRLKLPLFHAPALVCLAIAYLAIYHSAFGLLAVSDGLVRLAEVIVSEQTGVGLAGLVFFCALTAECLARAGFRIHGVCYALASSVLAVISLAIVNGHGLEQPASAAVITGLYVAGALASNLRWRLPAIDAVALTLSPLATIWAMDWACAGYASNWGLALAIHSLLLALVCVVAPTRLLNPSAWRHTSLGVAILAFPLAVLSSAIPPYFIPPTSLAVLATALILLAWVYQRATFTCVGAGLLLGALIQLAIWGPPSIRSSEAVTTAILAHASFAAFIGVCLRARLQKGGRAELLFARPAPWIALASSLTSFVSLTIEFGGRFDHLAVHAAWISVIWLTISLLVENAFLFGAFQVALSCAVISGVTSWLQTRSMLDRLPEDLFRPEILQSYGIGLAALGLFWLVGRRLLRKNEPVQALLNPGVPAFDWVMLGCLVLGQFALIAVSMAKCLTTEFWIETPYLIWPADPLLAFDPAAWLLVAILGIDLVVALWERERRTVILGMIVWAASVSMLAAGPFSADQAALPALCWSLALCFLFLSGLIWLPLRSNAGLDPAFIAKARRLIFSLTAIPVVALVAYVFVTNLLGAGNPTPLPNSIFARIGIANSLIGPLVLICCVLVGHSLRESLVSYVFWAGLVANLAVLTSYVLSLVDAEHSFDALDAVRLIQLSTITSACWGLFILAARFRVPAWCEEGDRPAGRILFSLQVQHGVIGNAILLASGLILLVCQFPVQPAWSIAAGSAWGWTALVLTLTTIVVRSLQVPGRPIPGAFQAGGLGLFGLLACSMLAWWPEEAYRTLLLGWAVYMPILVAGAWLWSRRTSSEGLFSQALSPAVVAGWIRIIGIAVVLLSINAAIAYHDLLWSAAALAIAGTAGAAMAVWCKREDWAFLAGACVNLAASFVVWHLHEENSLDAWWIVLAQANIAAAAVVALLWLGVQRFLFGQRQLSLASSPLLAAQISLAFGSNVALLALPCFAIVTAPWLPIPEHLVAVGSSLGWIALLLTAVAAYWHAGLQPREHRVHVLFLAGLLLGVMSSVSSAVTHLETSWYAYHVLMATWMGLGLLTVLSEPLARFRNEQAISPFPYLASLLTLSQKSLRNWLLAIGLLVLALGLRVAVDDPLRPYWSAGAVLIVSIMAAADALRARSQISVFLSGLLVPLACCLCWIAWYPLESAIPGIPAVLSLSYSLLLGLSVASVLWTLIEFIARSGEPGASLRDRGPVFAHVAAWMAAGLGAILAAGSLAGQGEFGVVLGDWLLAASALATLGAAFIAFLWDAEAPAPLAGLYATGLLALVIGLQSFSLPIERFGWLTALTLSGYVLLAAVLGRAFSAIGDLWQALRIKQRFDWPEIWFLAAQCAVGLVVLVLGFWIALTFRATSDRMAGALSIVPMAVAAVFLANGTLDHISKLFRGAAFFLGVVLAVEVAWATLDLGINALGLHRSALLLLALAAMTISEGVILPRFLNKFEAWSLSSRRAGHVLLAITTLVLAGLLAHEGAYFDPATKHTPLVSWETAGVALAIVGLAVSGICFAVAPSMDPYRLSERRRPLYVYGAELMLLFLFLHVRLNVPELFGGVLTRFWPLVVMAIAFVGVGLSEYFERLGITVLARPLQRTGIFMPALPLLAFWIRPPRAVFDFLVHNFSGLQPALEPLVKVQPNFGRYAILWFVVGMLYSWMARIKRSYRFALLAALAGNFGLWALLFNADFSFFLHPQMWLIPLALIILVSEHINRQELGPQKSSALRYLGLTMIYVSSTADMFLAWGENSYLPLVLAALCIVGVLTGILLRVTAFLYLGTSFLCVVVFSMIWHAAVDHRQVWLWWASGIALGAIVFALFAVFEKRRDDVLKLIEDIKTWE